MTPISGAGGSRFVNVDGVTSVQRIGAMSR